MQDASALLLYASWSIAALSGCGSKDAPPANDSDSVCPRERRAPDLLPGIRPEHRTLAYWIERTRTYANPDEVLLTPEQVVDHNRSLDVPRDEITLGATDLLAPIDQTALLAEVNERLAFMREELKEGRYVHEDGERASAEEVRTVEPVRSLVIEGPRIHIALATLQIRCGPFASTLRAAEGDKRFDRNSCSAVRAQEPVQMLARWPNGMKLVRIRQALGFLPADAPLSKALSANVATAYLSAHRVQATSRLSLAGNGDARARVEPGTILAALPGDTARVYFGSEKGVLASQPLAATSVRPTRRPLTRRAIFEEAFRLLDQPYGWGGQDGGRDCSSFLLDVFDAFDVELPRYSGRQAQAGTFSIDVEPIRNEHERIALIEAAARRGIVLLHFPGHIMLYLGRAADGRPMVLHAFAEYLTPCETGAGSRDARRETLQTVDRITVSDLELGRGSSRGAFIERLTRVTVIGQPPDEALIGASTLRPAAPPNDTAFTGACRDSERVQVFRSPERLLAGTPMKIVATTRDAIDPVMLVLVAPNGERMVPPLERLGGPPHAYWTRIERPIEGTWRVVLGDGSRIEACSELRVHPAPLREPTVRTRSWNAGTEDLYAAFVERLFDYPLRDDPTWPSLQVLLLDESRNLLFNHLGLDEERTMRPLEPDCADLPYFLRAYFAWKLGLPDGFRRCARGRAGQPPTCGDVNSNITPPSTEANVTLPDNEPATATKAGPIETFDAFMRSVASGVHSASGRTAPDDDATDLYPVPLSRETLRPGTVFADPYGHLLVVARFEPQTANDSGVLVGADAQPDGTVALKRFWRGTFLFSPDTRDVGAGFKAWRPLSRDDGALVALDNRALQTSEVFSPWSLEQYSGTADDFYDRVEALINPRPLDAERTLLTLITALEEAVKYRVVSVQNGETFMATDRRGPIGMPDGNEIFETTGPWEDYATPSRDMRLLISIDAVIGFPARVSRTPERYGLSRDSALGTSVNTLRGRLDSELARRTFSYVRSDDSSQTLSLRDVVARQTAFEIAYNPNDCIETRWGARVESPEHATCRREAPAAQRAKMERYRTWFHERTRPAR